METLFGQKMLVEPEQSSGSSIKVMDQEMFVGGYFTNTVDFDPGIVRLI